MCDTGANRSSVISIAQYKAYCRDHLRPAALQTPPIVTTMKKRIYGLAGSEVTLGYAGIIVPIPGLEILPLYNSNIVTANTPTVWVLE